VDPAPAFETGQERDIHYEADEWGFAVLPPQRGVVYRLDRAGADAGSELRAVLLAGSRGWNAPDSGAAQRHPHPGFSANANLRRARRHDLPEAESVP
jgi:hypothetical protein